LFFPRLLASLLRLAGKLPLRVLHASGSALGWSVYGISPTYRRNLRANLAQAGYGDARTRREAIAAAGKMIAEVPALWFRPHADAVALVREADGFDAAIAAQARGEAVLLLAPHLGSFEAASQYVAHHMPLTVLYRPPKIAWVEPLMIEGRARPNVRLVPADVSGVRALFRALREGQAAGILPDQVPGEGEGDWAEFFGRPAYTMTLACKLAERQGVRCFLVFARRLPRGRGYAFMARPLPPARPGEAPARRLNRALEEVIRECPGQYLWSYNRYKVPRRARPV
jgi:Kdo2-lipid IVA lauroyltransferase/acyltransferase